MTQPEPLCSFCESLPAAEQFVILEDFHTAVPHIAFVAGEAFPACHACAEAADDADHPRGRGFVLHLRLPSLEDTEARQRRMTWVAVFCAEPVAERRVRVPLST